MIDKSKIEALNPPLHKADVVCSAVFNEDCMLTMKRYPDKFFNLAIVDPPYGIGMDGGAETIYKNGKGGKGFNSVNNFTKKKWDNNIPTAEYFCELFRVSKNQIIWGGNYFTEFLPVSRGWIFWDKKIANAGNFKFSDGELAWTSFDKRLIRYTYDWIGFGYLNNKAKQVKIHPTEKPIALYEMILRDYAKENDLIFDSHMGSGSLRLACHKTGLEYTGCEIDTEYFEAQEVRFKNFTAQTTLW